jgi:hypothetical protein
MPNQDLIIIEGYLLSISDKAILLDQNWIPKSQITNLPDFSSFEIGQLIEVEVPEWLAIEKEII